eukprot:TRINITY_DN5840_c0_g1_i1.p1 TRINITY_DN5840_c0_g1~~TRINITY_DN5840_c0_g1_i1.p1  ORF type:complete len:181 (+),score=31.49 TRINITY_DN5840_c0_g1_i1:53-595(+)
MNNSDSNQGTFSTQSEKSRSRDHSNDSVRSEDSDNSERNAAFPASPMLSLPFFNWMNLSAFNYHLNSTMKRSKYIGPLTVEERQERIAKYLEKKKGRRWKSIRYNIRKNLAEKRERFQGRFVKSKMPFYWNPANNINFGGSHGNMDIETPQAHKDHGGGGVEDEHRRTFFSSMRDPAFSD